MMKKLLKNLREMQKVYNYFNIFVPIVLFDRTTWATTGHRDNADATLSLAGIAIDVESAGDNLSFVFAHELAHIEQKMMGLPFAEKEADIRALEILEAFKILEDGV